MAEIETEMEALSRHLEARARAIRASYEERAESQDQLIAAHTRTIREQELIIQELRSKLEPPKRGLLVGGASHDNGDPTPVETTAMTPYGVRRTFWNREKLWRSLETIDEDHAAGRLPYVSYKVGAWSDTNAVTSFADQLNDELDSRSGRTIVCFHHEPENDPGDIARWTAMQDAASRRFTSEKVDYAIVLMGWHQWYCGEPEHSLESLFPHEAPIDRLDFDIYQPYGTWSGTGKQRLRWTDLETAYFEKIREFCEPRGLDWGLAETGFTDEAWEYSISSRKIDPFTEIVGQIARNGGDLYSYFNTAQNSGKNSWPLTGAKLEAFSRLLSGNR